MIHGSAAIGAGEDGMILGAGILGTGTLGMVLGAGAVPGTCMGHTTIGADGIITITITDIIRDMAAVSSMNSDTPHVLQRWERIQDTSSTAVALLHIQRPCATVSVRLLQSAGRLLRPVSQLRL